jgi:hypothetical protein
VSIFPTKILLASDGSEEAELALITAIDLTNNTNSELHVVTVGGVEYRHVTISRSPAICSKRHSRPSSGRLKRPSMSR